MLNIALFNKSWSRFQDADFSLDFIGYIDFKGSLFLSAKELAEFILERKLVEMELQLFLTNHFLTKANGNFAFIIKKESSCILVCDYTRNYPLYIIKDNSEIIVTDHIGEIPFIKMHDKLAQEEFLLSGLVTGNRTVFNNVKALQAGEVASIIEDSIQFYRYFVLKSDPFRLNSSKAKETIYHETDVLFLNTFKRMIKSCPYVNNWIVPLSGGHDSRLIINYLHRLGCKNVICFTYGIPSSKEAKLSHQAAEALGYKWFFVEYTPQAWGELHTNGLFDRFINYSFNGCCLPHQQDLLALYKLSEWGILSDNDVIVPGHTAFTEAENSCIKSIDNMKDSIRYVFDKYYVLFNCENQFDRFELILEKLFEISRQNQYSFPEYFNWQERQAKYINNSVRAYEFFDLHWRMPFWEKEIIDFWQRIDFNDRIERKILFSASNEYLFVDALKRIPVVDKYDKPKQSSGFFMKFLPSIFVSIMVRILNKSSSVAEGTNLVYVDIAKTIKGILGPINLYPKELKTYFNASLIRRPFQINISALTAIYTLRNEVFKSRSQ